MDLSEWIIEFKLQVNKINEYIIEIQNFGNFLIIDSKENRIIDNDFNFILNDEDYRRIEKYSPNFLLFQFGKRWYYSKLIEKINKKNQLFYEVDMNQFTNIGECLIGNNIDFVHLGIHSEYELLNGSGHLEDWVKKAKFFKHKALGICDKNTLAGVLSLQLECIKNNIKSIIGETISVKYDEIDGVDLLHEIKLYVKDKSGWQNLLRINKIINVDNVEKQYIDEDDLFKFTDGLILVFCKESLINQTNDQEEIIQSIEKYLQNFDQIYYQIDTVEFISDEQDLINLRAIQYYLNNWIDVINPILINDSYYIDKEQNRLKFYLNSIDRKVYPQSDNQYYKDIDDSINILLPLFDSNKQYCKLEVYDIVEKMIKNTNELSNSCNFLIDTINKKLPVYEFTDDPISLFFELIEKGIIQKLGNIEDIDKYIKRIEIEVEVIINAGFVDYFLMLWDCIKWSKDNDIMVGTGRGSVCGSLIAFLLDITTVNPIKHDLLFERFMNPSRFILDEYFDILLEDGIEMKRIKKGTKLKLKNGDECLVEELVEGSVIDLDLKV